VVKQSWETVVKPKLKEMKEKEAERKRKEAEEKERKKKEREEDQKKVLEAIEKAEKLNVTKDGGVYKQVCMYVCICKCVCIDMDMDVHVCTYKRERERKKEREQDQKKALEAIEKAEKLTLTKDGGVYEQVACVCVCMYACMYG